LGICTTELLFEDLEKVEFRLGTTQLKKSRFFLKNDASLKNPPFWIIEKSFDSKKTLRTQSRLLKSAEN
jgi:hypothetical protein